MLSSIQVRHQIGHRLLETAVASVLIAVLVFLTMPYCLAQTKWKTNGVPVCKGVNGRKYYPASVSDGSGGVIVVWMDKRASEYRVYAQRILPNGASAWKTNGVEVCNIPGNQNPCEPISDGSGGAIIAWTQQYRSTSQSNIYAQRIGSDGKAKWPAGGVPVCLSKEVKATVMVPDKWGGAIIAWLDSRNTNLFRIYAQHLDKNGVCLWQNNGVKLVDNAIDLEYFQVTGDGLGGMVVFWNQRYGTKIEAQKVDSNGKRLWGNNGTPIYTAFSGNPFLPSGRPIPDGLGGAIVSWLDNRGPGGHYDIYAQRVTASGSTIWHPDGVLVSTDGKEKPWVWDTIPDGSDGVIVAYSSNNDTYAQRISWDGKRKWSNVGVPLCTAKGVQKGPVAATDGPGGAIIAWFDARSGEALYAQEIDSSGKTRWQKNGCLVSDTNVEDPDSYPENTWITSDDAGGAVVTWTDVDEGGLEDTDIYAQLISDYGKSTWYLAEGCTTNGFKTWLLQVNPGPYTTTTKTTCNTSSGPVDGPTEEIPPGIRRSIDVSQSVESQEVAITVEGDKMFSAERSMYLNEGKAAHSSIGTVAPSNVWYMAEGATIGGFETFICVVNPGEEPAEVTFTYQTGEGEIDGPLMHLEPQSRGTVYVGETVQTYNVSTKIESDRPVVAERAMYFNWDQCATCSIGAMAPDTSWYAAEGASDWLFETWICIQNPSEERAEVSLTYMTDAGEVEGPTLALEPGSRRSENVGDTVKSMNVSTLVESSQPVVVERSTYFNNRECATGSIAARSPANTWIMAEGCSTGGYETWICIQNPGAEPAGVRVIYMTDEGEVAGPSFALNPRSRISLLVAESVESYNVSTRVESDQPVVVERTTYYNNRNCAHGSIGYPVVE